MMEQLWWGEGDEAEEKNENCILIRIFVFNVRPTGREIYRNNVTALALLIGLK